MPSNPRKPSPKLSEESCISRGRTRPEAIFPVAPPASTLPETYAATLHEVKTHLRNARIRAILAANPIVIESKRTASSPSMPCAAWTNPSPSPPGRPNSPNPFPEELRGSLPTIEEIEAELAGDPPPESPKQRGSHDYRDMLDTIHQNHAHIPFSDRVVLQFHRDLLKYAGDDGGHWKISSNEIRETLPDGTKRVRFEPVAPHLTEDAMRLLHEHFADARRDGTWDPLFLIPFYILDFLCIHPFADGNGRMARLLSLLALYHQGYEVGRFISLERIIEKTKESYYETLYLSSQGWHEGKHDVWPWTEYFLGTLLAAYSEFEARFDRIGSGRGSKTETVQHAIQSFIADFSLSDLEKACPMVSRDMIRHVLFDLKKFNLVECLGRGRSAKWRKIG